MRNYVRVLLCEQCSSVCELVGEHANTWECVNCGAEYPATEDEQERWMMEEEDAKAD